MKTAHVILLTFLMHLSVYAQEKLSAKNDQVRIAATAANPRPIHISPLCVIKAENKKLLIPGTATTLSHSLALNELDADWIQSVTVLKDEEATNKYGRMGQYGVIVIDLKEGSLEKMPPELVERFTAD